MNYCCLGNSNEYGYRTYDLCNIKEFRYCIDEYKFFFVDLSYIVSKNKTNGYKILKSDCSFFKIPV